MKYLFVLLAVFFSLFINAQILNIERYKIEKDTSKKFMLKVTAGLNIYNRSAAEDSPVNLIGYNLDVNAMYYPGKHAFIFISNLDYLKINDSDFLNFGFLHGRINFLRERNVNYEVFLQYSYDNFRGLDPRILGGISLRKNLIKNENITFLFGVGMLYEFEKWIHPQTEMPIDVQFFKNSNYLSLRYTVNEFLDLNTLNYYQIGYDKQIEDFRHRISSMTTLNTKITSRFSLTNSIEISYEDKPIIPITKFIFAFRTGLSYDF